MVAKSQQSGDGRYAQRRGQTPKRLASESLHGAMERDGAAAVRSQGGQNNLNAAELRQLASTIQEAVDKSDFKGRLYKLRLKVEVGKRGKVVVSTEAPAPRSPGVEAALQRGAAKVAEILKGEDMLSAAEFGARIGASHETVHAKRRRGELLALTGATRGYHFPAWQIDDAGLPMAGLGQLAAALGHQPWRLYRYLTMAHGELGGRTGLEMLKTGQLNEALAHIAAIDHGAFS